MNKAMHRAALQSIARDAARGRLGDRGPKDRAGDLEIIIRGASSTASPDAEAYGMASDKDPIIDDEDEE